MLINNRKSSANGTQLYQTKYMELQDITKLYLQSYKNGLMTLREDGVCNILGLLMH